MRYDSSFFFSSRRQKALSNILKAYSIFNVDIGYCQGMADIAALLVMYMEEEVRQTMPCPPPTTTLELATRGSS